MKIENLTEWLNGYDAGYKDFRVYVFKIIERLEKNDLSTGQLEILNELEEEMRIIKDKDESKKI